MKIDMFLQNLGIAGHPGLRVDTKLIGYEDYTFGCRVTLSRPTVRHLAHELAHAAQFGPRNFKYRAFRSGFNFRSRRVFLMGQYWDDPRTAGATLRELDTYAYQAHLMELAGIRFNRERLFRMAVLIMTTHMHDWHCVPGTSKAERRAWCMQQLHACYARRKPQTVLRRLNGWLDETEKHLAT